MDSKDIIFKFEDYCTIIEQLAPSMEGYLFVYDLKVNKYYIAKKALERFSIPSALIYDLGAQIDKFVCPDDIDLINADLARVMAGIQDTHNVQYRWIGKDGKYIWINCMGKVLYDEDKTPLLLFGCVNELGLMAKADNVSGLLQSTLLKTLITKEYSNTPKGFVLRLGIDGFKDINENFGFDYGDFVLKGVADCILENVEAQQNVYHVVADEYMIIDFSGQSARKAHELYKRIRKSVDKFIEDNDFEAVYTISGGIVECKQLGDVNYSEIMKLSQFALNKAKYNGKNQVYTYNTEDYNAFIRKKMLLSELRAAVENDFSGFEVYFQPIMRGKEGNEKLYGAESLLRFVRQSGEMVSPVEFIPILEESGLIIPVGKWVLDQAGAFCKEVKNVVEDFKISVNLSYVQILKSSVLNEVFEVVTKYGLNPSNLVIEMTESGYLDDTPAVKRVWNNLRKFGVYIAIDDFGTGYSNLLSISKFTPDIVKLDRGFTIKALSDSFQNQLMNNVIQLVHSINIKICVEGVENKEELDRLSMMHPDYVQGYYYSKPCRKEEFLNNFVYEI
ncbi:MAG: GGDEF and EAL domain-containing protein [Agathobacter sp.]|nr:GGDEF and EAL domain-containing protein [Agathobacter sp.]